MDKKIKTILIADGDFNSPVQLKDCHKPEVIVIDTVNPIIEINGVKYQKREEKSSKGNSKSFGLMAATMAMCGGLPSIGGSDYTRKRPVVDIVEEFKLIQAKKSKLCRSDRDWVVNQFKYMYNEVKS